jgi:hypothetical protein
LQKSAEALDFKELGLHSLFSGVRKSLKKKELTKLHFMAERKRVRKTLMSLDLANKRDKSEIGIKVKAGRIT